LSAVAVVHGSLKSVAPPAPVLRSWYLLWESFRQGFLLPELDSATDYLPDALDAFPNDAELLLAAGTRHELYWWSAPDNSQRNLSRRGGAGTNQLRTAERLFRKSLESNPSGQEARLRLGRVLSMLGSFDGAKTELAQVASQEPGFLYLQHLFLGDVLEQTGDPTGAASEYDRAIALVGNSQAARIAGAHVVHGSGRRIEAAAGLTSALAVPATTTRDPWSAYLTGYWRHGRDHLTRARALLGQSAGTDARE
jgi:tetratricopeptide (TPR) repeat protein